MQKNANYFISDSNIVYPSEITLWRAEKLTAKDCMVVQAPEGARVLYLVEGRRGSVAVFSDQQRAWMTFQRINARGIESYLVA